MRRQERLTKHDFSAMSTIIDKIEERVETMLFGNRNRKSEVGTTVIILGRIRAN